jgi:predicted lipoprotein
LLGIITSEAELCAHCFDYKKILVKKKLQHEMGRRFQCRWPQDGAQVLTMEPEPAVRRKADGQKALNISLSVAVGDGESSTKKRARPYHYKKMCSALQNLLFETKGRLNKSQTMMNEVVKESSLLEAEKDRTISCLH